MQPEILMQVRDWFGTNQEINPEVSEGIHRIISQRIQAEAITEPQDLWILPPGTVIEIRAKANNQQYRQWYIRDGGDDPQSPWYLHLPLSKASLEEILMKPVKLSREMTELNHLDPHNLTGAFTGMDIAVWDSEVRHPVRLQQHQVFIYK